jgi:hypothetical protein
LSTRFHPTTKRIVAVLMVAFALIAVGTQTLIAAPSHTAAPSQTISLRSGHSSQVVRSGMVDLAKLPTYKGSASAAQTPKQLPVDRQLKTPAQQAAYKQWADSHTASLPHATGAKLPAGAISPNMYGNGATPVLVNQGEGINYTQSGCGCTPPDQAVGVQLGLIVEGVNNLITVYRTTDYSKAYGPWSAQTFFAPLFHSGDFFSDPQITYDAERGRWVVEWLEINSAGTGDYLDIAISKTSLFSSTSNFLEYQIAANVTGGNNFCDYDTLGYDYWGLYASCVAFDGVSGAFLGNWVFGFSLNNMQAGSLGTYDWWYDIPTAGQGSYAGAYRLSPTIEDGVPQAEWIIATDAGFGVVSQNVTTCAITNTHALGSATLPTATCIYNNLPLSYDDPAGATEPGGTNAVYPGYGTKQITYKNGQLYFALPIYINCSGTNDDGILWAQITPQLTTLASHNPQYVAGMVTNYTNDGYWCYTSGDSYMPSYFPSNEGDASLVFNFSSSTIYPSIAYTGRAANDAVGSMGQGYSYYAVQGTTSNLTGRWGDYSACALLPNLTTRGIIFCGGEYGGNDVWNTRLYQLRME